METNRLQEYDLTTLKEGLAAFDVALSQKQLTQLVQYYELLIEKNKVMNLTAITDFDEVVKKHFLDSIALVTALDPVDVKTVADVGTGAGFPGIPLKIAFPHLQITLMDALQKRVDFLNSVILKLGLKGIRAVHGRAEDLAREPKYREKFDLCVSRAVAALPVLSEYCLPFVGEGGLFIAYKAKDVETECRSSEGAVEELGGVIADLVLYELPQTDADRALVVIEKETRTPSRYPRRAGVPEKKPLRGENR